MKETIFNLALFFVFCILFSSLTGCSGSQANNLNANAPKPPANASPQSDTKTTAFPPLPSGISSAEIEMLDGTKSKVSDHKGKILILNLWGIWCLPCREEMPHLAAMQRKFGDKLEVISLNIGDHDGNPESLDAIKKFAAEMKIDYTLARLAPGVVEEFYSISKQRVVPQTIMADREGRLRGIFVGGGANVFVGIEQNLEKLIAE
jgi:thiol-disulfide isomerase/thioredoxin